MAEILGTYSAFSLFVVVLILVIYGGIWLILRPLVLWYFKIYTLVSELKENNALLKEILDELMRRNNQAPSSQRSQEDYSKYMPR